MKRLYTREEHLALVQNLRSKIPGIAITTDVIVGYAGESAADFALTLSLLDAVRFGGLFAFKYSPRPGTDSANEVDAVAETVQEARLQELLALNLDINASNAAVW